MEKSLKIKLIYRSITVLIAVVSLYFTVAGRGARTLIYYTTWSVWFASLTSFCSFSRTVREIRGERKTDEKFNALKFSSAVMIFATFVMSAISLPDKIWQAGYWTASSTFKHFLLPLAVVTDEIIFSKKGEHKWWFVLTSMIAPLFYWTGVLSRIFIARSFYGGAIPRAKGYDYYPYPFVYIDGGVSVSSIFLLLASVGVCLILISTLMVYLNKKAVRK